MLQCFKSMFHTILNSRMDEWCSCLWNASANVEAKHLGCYTFDAMAYFILIYSTLMITDLLSRYRRSIIIKASSSLVPPYSIGHQSTKVPRLGASYSIFILSRSRSKSASFDHEGSKMEGRAPHWGWRWKVDNQCHFNFDLIAHMFIVWYGCLPRLITMRYYRNQCALI